MVLAVFLSVGRLSHLVNVSAILVNPCLRTGKTSIRWGGKLLLNFIESYESPDGKKHYHFITSGCHFVSPDS